MEFCTNLKMLAIADTPRNGQRAFVRLRCKMWTCEYCAAINRIQWRAKLIHHIHATQGNWSWFTLTAHRYARGEQKSLNNLRGAWDSLMKRMKRKYGNFSYARIYEKHKDGSYHIHAIASFHFTDLRYRISRKDKKRTSVSQWLQKTAWELGIGMYTHAENITLNELHSGYVASYITKYIVKLTPEIKSEFGRVRHIQTSQNWIVKEFTSEDSWQLSHGIYYDDIIGAMDDKYELIDVQNDHVVTLDDLETSYIYPPEYSHLFDRS